MQRHIQPQLARDPLRFIADFLIAIVFARDQQRGDFEPNLGFVLEVLKRVQHRLQLPAAKLEIKFIGEAFEVHIGGIHLGIEFPARRIVHVTCRNRDGLDAACAAGVRDVHGIFSENHRIVVGKSYALAVVGKSGFGNGISGSRIGEGIHFFRLADIPVLAEFARQVATSSAERQHARPGIKMIERLLLDGINAKAGRTAVSGEHHGVIQTLAYEAGAALAFVQPAIARTQIALNATVIQPMPIFSWEVHKSRFSLRSDSWNLNTV